MIPRVAKLGTGFVGAGLYYMHDKREENVSATQARRPSAADYFLTDKGPLQTTQRVGFTATRNLATDDAMKALRQMAFTAAHAQDIRVAAVTAAAKAEGMNYEDYVKAANPFRGRKGQKPVYSLSLSWEPADTAATKENMLKAADEVRKALGLQDHQCLIIQHTDTKHPHIHLIINRVHPLTGRYASVANDRLKLSAWALDWEKRHGRVVCPARELNLDKRRANAGEKAKARAHGDNRAKSGYVKNTGLPPSEIEFWNKHGSHNLAAVRAARSVYQKQDHEQYRLATDRKLADVDLCHERANGSTLRRIERTLTVLRGQAFVRSANKPSSALDVVFGAVRGAALGIVAQIANRSDIAKLDKIKSQLKRERDIRRSEVYADRRQAFAKMQRIHAWQNWLDEKRCKTYRDSDTRDWRDRRDRWDLGKIKPPLFGTVDVTFYDVEESRNPRQAAEDRRKLNQPIEMRPISRDHPSSTPSPSLPQGPTKTDTQYVKRDADKHAARVAERAEKRTLERTTQRKIRKSGRKRRPRPR